MQSSNKGNPASKRMSNTHRKEYRKALWNASERRKETRRKDQQAREKTNKELRAMGVLTPWESARKARREARA